MRSFAARWRKLMAYDIGRKNRFLRRLGHLAHSICRDRASGIAGDDLGYPRFSPGRIIRLKPGATEPDVWANDPSLVAIDGIAFAGGKLYFNNVHKNLLQQIDIKPHGSGGNVTTLLLSGALSGPDGMRVGPGGALLIAENWTGNRSRVTRRH
jgi:sugar lactone lactonase YvrE